MRDWSKVLPLIDFYFFLGFLNVEEEGNNGNGGLVISLSAISVESCRNRLKAQMIQVVRSVGLLPNATTSSLLLSL